MLLVAIHRASNFHV